MKSTKSAANEVSKDEFILACVAFQRAKADLSRHFGEGTSIETIAAASQAVYDLANKAVGRRMKDSRSRTHLEINAGKRPVFRDVIAKIVGGRPTFTVQQVMQSLERQKLTPDVKNLRGYIATTLAMSPLFKRVSRGTYKLDGRRKGKRLTLKTKVPKTLPASP